MLCIHEGGGDDEVQWKKLEFALLCRSIVIGGGCALELLPAIVLAETRTDAAALVAKVLLRGIVQRLVLLGLLDLRHVDGAQLLQCLEARGRVLVERVSQQHSDALLDLLTLGRRDG